MTHSTQGCRKAVKSGGGATWGEKWGGGGNMGGGNISDYVLLVVPCTSRGVWGHAPQIEFFGIFVL